ncbi:MAG: YdeI/OmpD-associated family protein [Clostridia bacterium]|nr:YdeI/OmpD-associated family protein [Clostridia bacterium]
MKSLIESGKMTEAGLKYFDIRLIHQIDQLKANEEAYKEKLKTLPEDLEAFFKQEGVLEIFHQEKPSMKKNYLGYILAAKQEKTRIRRCFKIVSILKGEKNNL